ncbi:MAG: tetratricopeptide repeat protein [Myxococcota bacterium]
MPIHRRRPASTISRSDGRRPFAAAWPRRAAALSLVALLAQGACAPHSPEPAAPSMAEQPAPDQPKLLDGLGGQKHPITTTSALAQRYFDQGLILTFGFNHEAAVRSFEAATRFDPECAMCFWGIALALGPNINAPMGPEAGARAYAAAQAATRLAPKASAAEQAYIAAVAARYASPPPQDRSALDRAYAEAMGKLHAAYPDDVDATVLYAESLMDLYPWDYWTDAAEPREHTLEIVALLEESLAARPDHVGANHYYIHAVEEYYPEKAEAAADRLGALAPDAGHLVHMPSHIYYRLGRYDDALEINRRAVAADEAFFSWCRPDVFYRAAYYPHNIHFLWAAANAEGRSELAIMTARKLAAKTSEQLAALPFLEEFQAIPILTLVRFGRWDAVLGEPAPPEEHVYLQGTWHYARGMALLRTDRVDEAEAELARLRTLANDPRAEALILAGGTASARTLLGIATAHLEGEVWFARGDLDAAVSSLEQAVALEKSLVYMEPPPWYAPTRQYLGAVLLAADRAPEAESVYRADLEKYPGNGWSLFGLTRSFEAQGRDAEAAWAKQGFQTAWARADVELTSSRF